VEPGFALSGALWATLNGSLEELAAILKIKEQNPEFYSGTAGKGRATKRPILKKPNRP
jgi:hypothetical protein